MFPCTEAITRFFSLPFLNYTIISVFALLLNCTFVLSSPSSFAACVGEARRIQRGFFLFRAPSPQSLRPISSDGGASWRRACKKDLQLCEPNPPASLILPETPLRPHPANTHTHTYAHTPTQRLVKPKPGAGGRRPF